MIVCTSFVGLELVHQRVCSAHAVGSLVGTAQRPRPLPPVEGRPGNRADHHHEVNKAARCCRDPKLVVQVLQPFHSRDAVFGFRPPCLTFRGRVSVEPRFLPDKLAGQDLLPGRNLVDTFMGRTLELAF